MSPVQVAKPIVLDLLAAIIFAGTFFVARDLFGIAGIDAVYCATVAGIGTGLFQLVHKKMAREAIGPLQWLSLGVVVTLGLMTIALHNEHFIKLKPTVIDLAVGIFMATRDWMTPYLPAEVRENIPRRTIRLTEYAWAAMMIFFALVNVAFAFYADFAVWAIYATFVPTLIIVGLFFLQYVVFRRLARHNARVRAGAQAA
ncbi:MAG TPA: septation protein IspZ [Rhizomicrobium sp.]|jgi:intracellular septation protein|nr:septation protein IspZ [Rhizomicrobium sp.]